MYTSFIALLNFATRFVHAVFAFSSFVHGVAVKVLIYIHIFFCEICISEYVGTTKILNEAGRKIEKDFGFSWYVHGISVKFLICFDICICASEYIGKTKINA